jgi:hypothetical protein
MSAIKNFYHDQICEGMQNEEFTQEQQDQMMIAEFEAKKQAVLESEIPAFFSQDPSIF